MADQHITEQYIIFTLGEEEYAMPITIVDEIVKVENLIPVPKSKPYFTGVMDIRGKVVNMIDLAKKLGIRDYSFNERSKSERAIIVNIFKKPTGILVDKVAHVIHLPPNAIDPPPPSVKGISSRYIIGVGKKDNRFIILIDIEKIMSAEDLSEINNVF